MFYDTGNSILTFSKPFFLDKGKIQKKVGMIYWNIGNIGKSVNYRKKIGKQKFLYDKGKAPFPCLYIT